MKECLNFYLVWGEQPTLRHALAHDGLPFFLPLILTLKGCSCIQKMHFVNSKESDLDQALLSGTEIQSAVY